jgi:hypothetical protein
LIKDKKIKGMVIQDRVWEISIIPAAVDESLTPVKIIAIGDIQLPRVSTAVFILEGRSIDKIPIIPPINIITS